MSVLGSAPMFCSGAARIAPLEPKWRQSRSLALARPVRAVCVRGAGCRSLVRTRRGLQRSAERAKCGARQTTSHTCTTSTNVSSHIWDVGTRKQLVAPRGPGKLTRPGDQGGCSVPAGKGGLWTSVNMALLLPARRNNNHLVLADSWIWGDFPGGAPPATSHRGAEAIPQMTPSFGNK